MHVVIKKLHLNTHNNVSLTNKGNLDMSYTVSPNKHGNSVTTLYVFYTIIDKRIYEESKQLSLVILKMYLQLVNTEEKTV